MEISQKRFLRLRESRCVLGEPDVLVIHEIKCSSSFFGKEKRLEDHQEYFITGLVFPNTAHFSTFISSKIKTEGKSLVKASLLVFDVAFQERDIHIDINIPGSMEIKAYTLKGEETTYSSQDYDYSYNSSVLRSLRIMEYPNIVAYPFVHRLEFLRGFMKGFIRFNFEQQNELRPMDYEELDKETWIDILLNYCLDNQSNVLLQEIIQEVRKYSVAKANEYELKFKLHAQLHREIIAKTAEKLLLHPSISLLKEFQIEALFKERRFKEVVQVGRNILHSSMSNYATYARVAEAYSELNMDRQFLTCMNLVTNLCGEEKELRQVTHMKSNVQNLNHTIVWGNNLSMHPELLFQFGNSFLNLEYNNYKDMLKNSSKEGITFNVVSKLEATLEDFPKFYMLLVKFEKRKSWKELVKCRAECFWLQKDFIDYEDKMQVKPNFQFNSFVNIGEEQSQRMGAEERGVESFDGGLSEHEDEQEMVDLPPCSRRVNPLKKRFLSENKKMICNMNLERLFLLLAEDIKLQNAMEKWELKMKDYEGKSLSAEKKELIAIIFLKKALLHRKLMRNKKCEQSFKISRKLSASPEINIIACYQLVLLYMETNIVKGVEFYLIELVNIIFKMGVVTFDIVPEWVRPILSYLLKHEGIGAVKRAKGNLKSLLALFLRGNYTVEFIEELIKDQGKKDRVEPNKT